MTRALSNRAMREEQQSPDLVPIITIKSMVQYGQKANKQVRQSRRDA